MPWKEICTVELRERLVSAVLHKDASVTEMCRIYGVSRKTAYKWIERHKLGGRSGLEDRSRTPQHQPGRVSDTVTDEVLAARNAHPTWGARKLHPLLARTLKASQLPAVSTIGRILAAAELTGPRGKPRPAAKERANRWRDPLEPNEVWTIDFKGEFKLGDTTVCYPLTVRDAASRYVLAVDGKSSTQGAGVTATVERLFEEHGLPRCIRSDNGSPFAGTGLGRLSVMSVWWLRQGIGIDLITPGRPGENGAHEQMHRVLKAETARPPEVTMARQQRAFAAFCRQYNDERYHEGIGMKRPAEVYCPSPRRYRRIRPGEHPETEGYAGHWQLRTVRGDGTIKWAGQTVFISGPLSGCVVGLYEAAEGMWQVHFCRSQIGVLDRQGEQWRVRDPSRLRVPSPRKLYPC
jgi:putative transposase